MAKIIGIDLGNHELLRRSDGRQRTRCDSQQRRAPHDAVDRGIHRQWTNGKWAIRPNVRPSRTPNARSPRSSVSWARLTTRYPRRSSRVTYPVVKGDNNTPRVDIDGRQIHAAGDFGDHSAKDEKDGRGLPGAPRCREAVITVPAYFSDSQRQATKEAGEIAGLKVRRIINEPTAAALAYGLDKSAQGHENRRIRPGRRYVRYFDPGTGRRRFRSEIDQRRYAPGRRRLRPRADRLDGRGVPEAKHNIDLRKDPMAMQRLKEAAEKAKIELSSSTSTEINLPYIMPVDGIPQHLVMTLTRAKFEQLCRPSDPQAPSSLASKALARCGSRRPSEIDEVILVGGSTRIPAIQKVVEDFFGKVPSKGREPRRSGCHRRCDPGRCPDR